MSFSYYNPVEIHFDIKFEKCLSAFDKKYLLVTSKSFTQRGYTEKIKNVLGNNLLCVVDSVFPNPELAYMQELKKKIKTTDCIIAFGGGSVIDSAKFLSVKGDITSKHGLLNISLDSEFIPIYAFPTTHGASSEITKWATIWDKHHNIKYSLQNDNLYPKKAFYDCSLMFGLNLDMTIYTSLDALSHAIESIWNKNSNPISTNYAIKSIELILNNLLALSNNLDSMVLRKNITLASIYSGLAFSNTQTALAHAISYPITMKFNIPHGLACSFCIPLLLDCIEDEDANSTLLPFKKRIINLFNQLNISQNPKDYGVDKEFIKSIFTKLNSRAKNGLLNIDKAKQLLLNIIDS